jgi:hypothetical protein
MSRRLAGSCVCVREGVGEALAGVVRAGLWSRERSVVWGADAVTESGRRCLRRRYRESSWDPARSESLGTYGDLHAREPGGPVVARGPLFDASSRMVHRVVQRFGGP